MFGYGGRPVLNHVSARIEVGQKVAIVGPTGSGKSTLVSLLARLHEPPPGTVFVDGTDVREIPLAVLRGSIGFVPQEPFLFSDTLADNVAFGLDAITGAVGRVEAGGAGERRAGQVRRVGQVGQTRRALQVGFGNRRRRNVSSESRTPRRSRVSTRTSPIFPRATTRSSASAASRCRAARSSAPPSPAPSSSIPRF